MNDEPMVTVSFQLPVSVVREFRRTRGDSSRTQYTNWALGPPNGYDAATTIEGTAKLAALDVELPPELPEVGRRIKIGNGSPLYVDAVVESAQAFWFWGRYHRTGAPSTYRLPKDWTYAD